MCDHGIDDHGRAEPRLAVGDRDSLIDVLEFQRQTLRWKCERLFEDQLHARSVPTSSLTLAGLLSHLTLLEDWVTETITGVEQAPWASMPWGTWNEFDVAETMDALELDERWLRAVGRCSQLLEAVGLDDVHGPDATSTRYLVLSLIQEYARHNGHADLLREAIDGETGA